MSEKITVKINDQELKTNNSKTVLEVCRENDFLIPTLCEIEEIADRYGGCRVCLVEIKTDRGTIVTTSCDTPVQDEMEIRTDTEEVISGRKMALELILSEHKGDCIAPCSIKCPASLDVQGYLAEIAKRRPKEAVKLIKEKSPLALSLGRACFAPCEEECRRQLVEDPIAIRQEKMYAAEVDIENPWIPDIPDSTGRQIGIVGGGPTGLTAAYFLRLKGHEVTIYDMMPKLGGMMRYGIPNYRLPKDLLDKEIDWILNLGIKAETNIKMGEDIELEYLRDKHDAVFVATGAWESWMVPIEGKELPGVIGGIDFLINYTLEKKLPIGNKVVVVGCGNTAMDVARTAKRLGKEVTIAYRRTLEQAPANEEEIEEAKEEGIKFVFLASPKKVCGCEEEGIQKVTCACMELGDPDESGRPKPIEIPDEELDIEADTVILAIGQSPDLDLLEEQGLKKNKYTLKANRKFQTNFEDVFTAGDVLIGASSIVECTGQGREAAFALDAYLNGEIDDYEIPEDYKIPFKYIHEDTKTEEDFADWNKQSRVSMTKREPKDRINDFDKIENGYSDKEAIEEAERCIECGCLDRYNCLLREYADLYEAEQKSYIGYSREFEIDESHPNMIMEHNKCILCGSCIRISDDVHSEGILSFVNRGIETKVSPPFNKSLIETDSKLLGDIADRCPTGAITEIPKAFGKTPFKIEKEILTNCLGCGLTCPANLKLVNGRPYTMNYVKDSYINHLCDIGKFKTLPDEKKVPYFNQDKWSEFKRALRVKNFDIVVSPNITIEEAKLLKQLANELDGKITSNISNKRSNVKLKDLNESKKIFVDSSVLSYCPVMKIYIEKAKKNGTKIVESLEELNDGIAILDPGSETNANNRLVIHRGANNEGLLKLNIKDNEIEANNVLLYGDFIPKYESLRGKNIIHFTSQLNDISKKSELVFPIRPWIEKQGTIKNSLLEEIKLKSNVESKLKRNVDLIEEVLEVIDK